MALRAVAAERSFGRAAERLGYTQSAVSQQIAGLERVVGGALFERPGGPRPVSLTPLGRRLLSHAEDIVERLSVAESDLEAFVAGMTGTLSVGTFQSTSVRILPTVIRRIRRSRPDLELRLTDTNDQEELIDALIGGDLDVSFVSGPVHDERLALIELMVDPFVLVSPVDTDLARGRRTVPATELEGVALIGEHDGTCQRQIEGSLDHAGVSPRVTLRSVDNAAILAMVAAGMGHAVMPALAVEPAPAEVLIRRLQPGIPPRVISVAKPARRAVYPATDLFMTLAAQAAEEVASTLEWARTGRGEHVQLNQPQKYARIG